MPYIKSYDVIGARLSNSSLKSISTTRVTGNNYIKSYNNPQQFNEFGFSILLPNVSNLKITSSFTTSKNATKIGKMSVYKDEELNQYILKEEKIVGYFKEKESNPFTKKKNRSFQN